jgi:hypothetical protein
MNVAAETSGANGDSGEPEPLGDGTQSPGEPCNGRTAYCALAYDEVCFAATEDSAANSSDYWEVPAQDRSILEQLRGGIRALSLGVVEDGGTLRVCRGSCEKGNTPLGVVLADVAQFLDENPRDVVTLLVDGDVAPSQLELAFAANGLAERALAQTPDEPWPTLDALVDAGTRLVVFAVVEDDAPAWLLPRQKLLWETGRDWPSLAAMTCNPDVGTAARPLYVVHQNLVDDHGNPSAELAAKANALDVVAERLESCREEHGRTPNFVAIDFASEGDAIDATQVLNGVRTL